MNRINFDPGDPPDMDVDWGKDVLVELKKHDMGRWPWDAIVCSWTGRDADLSPTGHQGVSDVEADEDGVAFVVRAMCCHAGRDVAFYEDLPDDATDSDHDERVEAYLEVAYHVVCGSGFPGEWDGDDWLSSYEEKVRTEWVVADDGEVDIQATALNVLADAEDHLKGWDTEMTDVSRELNRLAGWPGNELPTDA